MSVWKDFRQTMRKGESQRVLWAMRGPLSLKHRAWDLALIRKEKEQMCFILFSAFLGRGLGSYDARGVCATEPHDPEHVLREDVAGTICPCFGPQHDSKSQSPRGTKQEF